MSAKGSHAVGERSVPKGQGTVGQAPAAPRATAAREGFEGGGSSAEFFGALAAHWKRQYPGWTAWLLSPDMKLPGLMRLKESRRVPLWNGAIECRLFRFDLVAGSNKRVDVEPPGPGAEPALPDRGKSPPGG